MEILDILKYAKEKIQEKENNKRLNKLENHLENIVNNQKNIEKIIKQFNVNNNINKPNLKFELKEQKSLEKNKKNDFIVYINVINDGVADAYNICTEEERGLTILPNNNDLYNNNALYKDYKSELKFIFDYNDEGKKGNDKIGYEYNKQFCIKYKDSLDNLYKDNYNISLLINPNGKLTPRLQKINTEINYNEDNCYDN